MKIVQIIAPARVGGAERVVLDLSHALADAGAELHLVAVLEAGEEEHPFEREVAPPVRFHRLGVPRRRYGWERRHVRRLLDRLAPSVVHTHGYRADVVDGPVARAAGLPVATTVHGFTGGGLKNRVYERLQRRAQRSFDAVVAVSRPLAGELVRKGVSEVRVHAIPNVRSAPEDPLPRDEARELLGLEDRGFHVGWIGRVSREKGPDLLLEALSRMRDPAVHATLIGDGSARARLVDRTLELGLADRVHWTGIIPDASRLLAAFDVLVISSRTEGTPMVVLEGMAAGIPLVATRVGGVPDLVSGDEALLVPPESSGELAGAIDAVRRHPGEARERADRARERFLRVSSVERWAQSYLEVYRRIASGDGAPHEVGKPLGGEKVGGGEPR